MNLLILILISSFPFAQDYPELGSIESLDFMTWNVQNYPKHNLTNSYMMDIIPNLVSNSGLVSNEIMDTIPNRNIDISWS